jgi:hypothetical protein
MEDPVTLVHLITVVSGLVVLLVTIFLYFRKEAHHAQDALQRVAIDVSGLSQHMKDQNGRIEHLEGWRMRITEQPPWQEVLINQGVLTGKLDAAIEVMNRIHYRDMQQMGTG